MVGKKRGDRAVKIDAEIADRAEKFISKKENKLKYSSIKQFMDIAVLDKLEREEGIEKKDINILKPSSNIFPLKREVKVPSGII